VSELFNPPVVVPPPPMPPRPRPKIETATADSAMRAAVAEPPPPRRRVEPAAAAIDDDDGDDGAVDEGARWWWADLATALVEKGRADRAGGWLPEQPCLPAGRAASIEGEGWHADAAAVAVRPASVAGERVVVTRREGAVRKTVGSCRGAMRIVDAAALGFDVPVHLRRRSARVGGEF
jgi:hypothetical protein